MERQLDLNYLCVSRLRSTASTVVLQEAVEQMQEAIMKIKQRRVINLQRNLGIIPKGTDTIIAIEAPERFRRVLTTAGFTNNLEVGEQVLPAPSFGPLSRYNALGKLIVHRNQPKETTSRVIDWHWIEWHGPDRVEQSKLVDVEYERYPRTFMPPPSVELRVAVTPAGRRVVVSPIFRYSDETEQELKHVINLYLEMFRECTILTGDLDQIIQAPIKRLNWRILPPGKRPWEQLREQLEPIVRRARRGNQELIWRRLQTINRFGPDFVAIGQGGFRGYVVFGFPDEELFVFESAFIYNATYVFDEQWEDLSKLTKAEILSEDLQKARIIHTSKWEHHVVALFANQG